MFNTGASKCPDLSIVHPNTAQPLTCQFHESCLSATCYENSTNDLLLGDLPQVSPITVELQPCSEPVHLTLGVSLFGSVLLNARVQGMGQVQLQSQEEEESEGDEAVYLQVLHWNLTPAGTLELGMQASALYTQGL